MDIVAFGDIEAQNYELDYSVHTEDRRDKNYCKSTARMHPNPWYSKGGIVVEFHKYHNNSWGTYYLVNILCIWTRKEEN